MREADSLAALAEDLRALTDRERQAVLAALSPFERAQVGALLDAAATPVPAEPPAPDYSRFSPWLARHLASDSGTGERNLTAATRQLLAEAAGQLAGGKPVPSAATGTAAKRRSLADAVAQLLSPRQVPR